MLNRSSAPSASTPNASASELAMVSVRDLPPPAAAFNAVLDDRVHALAGNILAPGCQAATQCKAARFRWRARGKQARSWFSSEREGMLVMARRASFVQIHISVMCRLRSAAALPRLRSGISDISTQAFVHKATQSTVRELAPHDHSPLFLLLSFVCVVRVL